MHSDDPELDHFLATRVLVEPGNPVYSASITQTWRVVDKMIHKYFCELKLDVFLGISGQNWRASFYSPQKCARYEGRGPTAPLAICRAARETVLALES